MTVGRTYCRHGNFPGHCLFCVDEKSAGLGSLTIQAYEVEQERRAICEVDDNLRKNPKHYAFDGTYPGHPDWKGPT